MEWTRAQLKERGKAAFKANYWKCVLVALILAFLTGSGASTSGSDTYESTKEIMNGATLNPATLALGDGFGEMQSAMDSALSSPGGTSVLAAIVGVVMIFAIVAVVLGVLLGLLVFNPLVVGCQKYFVSNAADEDKSLGQMGFAFKKGFYKNVVLTMFLRGLFNGLWYLLFIVPGIVKSYEYRMIPYLLAENPEMDWRDAFAESKRMMDGQKWDTFVLDLSFIGWNILAAITFGLVGIFYSTPYQFATNAELYRALKGYGYTTYTTGNDGYIDQNYTGYTEV